MAGSAQISVTTTATKLLPSNGSDFAASGNSLAIQNIGAVTVYLGGSDVTTGNGYPLAAGAQIGCDVVSGEDFYGIVASGTCNVAVLRSN